MVFTRGTKTEFAKLSVGLGMFGEIGFNSEESTTKVKDIVISIGRTGAATPVAILDAVKVAATLRTSRR